MITIKAEFTTSENFESAFSEALRIAKQLNCLIQFEFNKLICIASPEGTISKAIEMRKIALENNFNMVNC